MNIAEFTREHVLQPRLREAGYLVVYDVEQRYRQLCLDMADDRLLVIDTSESSIESRETALTGLQALGRTQDPARWAAGLCPGEAARVGAAKVDRPVRRVRRGISAG